MDTKSQQRTTTWVSTAKETAKEGGRTAATTTTNITATAAATQLTNPFLEKGAVGHGPDVCEPGSRLTATRVEGEQGGDGVDNVAGGELVAGNVGGVEVDADEVDGASLAAAGTADPDAGADEVGDEGLDGAARGAPRGGPEGEEGGVGAGGEGDVG